MWSRFVICLPGGHHEIGANSKITEITPIKTAYVNIKASIRYAYQVSLAIEFHVSNFYRYFGPLTGQYITSTHAKIDFIHMRAQNMAFSI